MLATAANALPVGPDWSYERKWDGYRALAVKERRIARLISRHGKDLTRDYPSLARAVELLPLTDVTLDGEIVAVDANGRPSFQALQHRITATRSLAFYAFDVLSVASESWIGKPLDARRMKLATIVKDSAILFSTPLDGDPASIERTISELPAREPARPKTCINLLTGGLLVRIQLRSQPRKIHKINNLDGSDSPDQSRR